MSGLDAKKPSIKVSAHVLVQLGEELVTDVEQAILECVKNAYDADSPGCSIKIDTFAAGVEKQFGSAGELLQFYRPSENVDVRFTTEDGKPIKISTKGVPLKLDINTPVVRELHWKGAITIEDKGDGISPDGIKSSWLVISNSNKRVSGGKKHLTEKGRTPLGDKGLGRLGSMKLGDLLLVESSQSAAGLSSSALFRWADCDYAHTVDEIPVRVLEDIPNKKKFKGTRVSVLGLRELEQWARPEKTLEITKSLARLISPFEAKSQFPVTVDVDGHKTSLVAVTDSLLSRAIAEFRFTWKRDVDGAPVLSCRARFKEKLFRPTGGTLKQQEKAAAVFGEDNGEKFLNWLTTLKRLGRFSIVTRPSQNWFVEFRQQFRWEDMLATGGPTAVDPGDLTGAFYYFHLNELGEDRNSDENAGLDLEATAGLGIDRSMIKDMAGISILRDGFRVRSSGDWLKMSEGMTTGSTYNLRYHNTLGFFSLTGEYNDGLVEKSDREGFVDNSPYRGFINIAETCKYFANDAIENVRRAQDKYANEQTESTLGFINSPERSLSLMDETVAIATQAQEGATSVVEKLNRGIALYQKSLSSHSNERALEIIKGALLTANSVQKSLSKNNQASSAVKILRNELSDNKERMLSLYESAAVGLSARGLAHELRTHLIEIRKRASALENAIKTGKATEAITLPHIRAIRSSCSSIANAASLIDPMLPRARAVKESINIRSFIEEYIGHRQIGLDNQNIEFKLKATANCIVRINRGRLLQVLDNLMHNSVYWLKRGSQTMQVERKKEISIIVSRNGFSLADTGPGVDPAYEDSIFEMFVSAKPAKERGQGLGLFIITQLLAADGAEIYLADNRNAEGRRYKFIVNLSSVVEER